MTVKGQPREPNSGVARNFFTGGA